MQNLSSELIEWGKIIYDPGLAPLHDSKSAAAHNTQKFLDLRVTGKWSMQEPFRLLFHGHVPKNPRQLRIVLMNVAWQKNRSITLCSPQQKLLMGTCRDNSHRKGLIWMVSQQGHSRHQFGHLKIGKPLALKEMFQKQNVLTFQNCLCMCGENAFLLMPTLYAAGQFFLHSAIFCRWQTTSTKTPRQIGVTTHSRYPYGSQNFPKKSPCIATATTSSPSLNPWIKKRGSFAAIKSCLQQTK